MNKTPNVEVKVLTDKTNNNKVEEMDDDIGRLMSFETTSLDPKSSRMVNVQDTDISKDDFVFESSVKRNLKNIITILILIIAIIIFSFTLVLTRYNIVPVSVEGSSFSVFGNYLVSKNYSIAKEDISIGDKIITNSTSSISLGSFISNIKETEITNIDGLSIEILIGEKDKRNISIVDIMYKVR